MDNITKRIYSEKMYCKKCKILYNLDIIKLFYYLQK